MNALFSFKQRVHLKTYSEYSCKAIAVEGAVWPTSLTGCQGLAGSALPYRGVLPEHLILEALFAFTPLSYIRKYT